MEYVYLQMIALVRKSLPNFQVQIQNLKIHKPRYVLEVKLMPVAFMFPLSLPHLNNKYRNDIEMDDQ